LGGALRREAVVLAQADLVDEGAPGEDGLQVGVVVFVLEFGGRRSSGGRKVVTLA